MFEVGFTELLLIFALSLVVLGPEKLPKLAQQVGRWVGRARAMARQFRDQLEEEASTLETKIDTNIDTSLDPRAGTTTPPQASTTTSTALEPVATPPVAEVEPAEEFYPPDHHMHSSNQPAHEEPAAQAADATGTQAELDLTTHEDDKRPTP